MDSNVENHVPLNRAGCNQMYKQKVFALGFSLACKIRVQWHNGSLMDIAHRCVVEVTVLMWTRISSFAL